MKTTGLKKNLVMSTLYHVLALILPLITAPYASRVLTVDGIGIYSYTHSYLMYFTIFGALGTASYGSREIARNRDDRAARSVIFWEITVLLFITSSVSIAAWGGWTLFNKRYQTYYFIMTVALFGTMFDISWLYAGLEQFRYTITHNLSFKILGTISIFLLVKQPGDLWKYILIVNLSQTLGKISMWIYLPRFVDLVSFKGLHIKKHFHETLVYFIPTIAISIYTILDKTLIGLITKDTSENGNYEQATKIVDIAKTLAYTGVNAVMQSRISYLYAEKKFDEIKYRINVSLDYVIFISVGLIFGIIGVSDWFVPLYFGSGYDHTIVLLKYMIPLVLIVGISNCLGSQYYNPAGLRAKSAKYIITGSVLNLCLNLILIPHFRSSGAVAATLIAEMTISALYVLNCDGYYTLQQLLQQVWKKLLAGVVMVVCIRQIPGHFQNVLLAICVQVIAGFMIYSLLLIAMKDSFMIKTALPQTINLIRRKKDRE